MSIRRDSITRNLEARKSSVPTIGKGKPLNGRGDEGDLTFRRTSEGLKLYIKANHSWHGIKIGESFDSLEKKINDIKSKVDTIKQFRLPSTYSVTGDFTLDVSGDIVFDADGGQITIQDAGADHFLFDCDATALTIYDDTAAADYLKLQVAADGASTISTNDNDGAAGDLTFTIDGAVNMDAAGEIIIDSTNASNSEGDGTIFKTAGTVFGAITAHHSISSFALYAAAGASTFDYFNIIVDTNAATTIGTTDAVGTVGHLTIVPDGDLILDPVSQQIIISATDKLFFDGGGDTYLYEKSADSLRFVVGGDPLLWLGEAGTAGNMVTFPSGVTAGFIQEVPDYDATDTNVYFSKGGQKAFLTFGSGNIADLNLHFPGHSCNCILVLKQDGTGSRTVAADGWLAFDNLGNGANGSSIILWPGGTEPTLTTDGNAVDIISFYWDNTNEIAYGVISLDFK